MGLTLIQPAEIGRIIQTYAVPLVLIWFVLRWFFLKPPTPGPPPPPLNQMHKATTGGAALGLLAALCVISAWTWWNEPAAVRRIQPIPVLVITLAGIVLGALTGMASDLSPRVPPAAPLAAAGPWWSRWPVACYRQVKHFLATPWWPRAILVFVAVAASAPWLTIQPPYPSALRPGLSCACMALVFGYRTCLLVKDLL
jgi:hypothetical protein